MGRWESKWSISHFCKKMSMKCQIVVSHAIKLDNRFYYLRNFANVRAGLTDGKLNLGIKLPQQEWIKWLGTFCHCQLNACWRSLVTSWHRHNWPLKSLIKICINFLKHCFLNHSWRSWSTLVLNSSDNLIVDLFAHKTLCIVWCQEDFPIEKYT